jgi:glutamine amidotransferase
VNRGIKLKYGETYLEQKIMKIDIIDYNVNNCKAVAKLFTTLGHTIRYVDSTQNADSKADLIVLPGVGHWKAGLDSLIKTGIFSMLQEKHISGNRILGICLGFQLLGTGSDEHGGEGLNLLGSGVSEITSLWDSKKAINSGWRNCESTTEKQIQKYYFTHRYAYSLENMHNESGVNELLWVKDSNIVAAFQKENLCGIQFHPEKSHQQGLNLIQKILSNWG